MADHHPHFVSAEPATSYGRAYQLRPFTGDEPDPYTLRPYEVSQLTGDREPTQ